MEIKLSFVLVRDICIAFTDIHIQRGTPVAGMRLLQQAIQYVRKSPEQLTPLHPQFLKLCLKSKYYQVAECLVNDEIFCIDEKSVKPIDYMTYFYYGGMVYTGLKRFTRAVYFYKLV